MASFVGFYNQDTNFVCYDMLQVKVVQMQEIGVCYLNEMTSQLASQLEHARLVEKIWGNSVHNMDNYLVRGFTTLEPVGDMPREQLDIPRPRPVLTHAHHGECLHTPLTSTLGNLPSSLALPCICSSTSLSWRCLLAASAALPCYESCPNAASTVLSAQ